MNTLIIILLIFGIFEILSNLFHMSKGSKIRIGESAKRQHQELPMDINLLHFYYKALTMLIIGFLYLASTLTFYLYDSYNGILFTMINSIIMSCYGLVQLILYFKTIKVWFSFVVYTIPLVILIHLLYYG
jgi:hypothetical protein